METTIKVQTRCEDGRVALIYRPPDGRTLVFDSVLPLAREIAAAVSGKWIEIFNDDDSCELRIGSYSQPCQDISAGDASPVQIAEMIGDLLHFVARCASRDSQRGRTIEIAISREEDDWHVVLA